jgi:hypothetical protein
MNTRACTDIAESIIQIGRHFPKTQDYLVHAKKNIHKSYHLWKAAILSFMHGVCPFLFEKSGEDLIRDIYYKQLLHELKMGRREITHTDAVNLSR